MLSALVTTISFTSLVKQCCLRAVGKGGQTLILYALEHRESTHLRTVKHELLFAPRK